MITSHTSTPHQIIHHTPLNTLTISERLSRNSSSAEIPEQSKPNKEEALEKCGAAK